MKMIGLARLGRDAEVRYTPGGDAVANLSLAYVCGRKKEGEQYAPSQWVNASLWGKQAEALAPYLKKGSVHCFVLADLRMEKWESQDSSGFNLVARVDSVELGQNGGSQGGSEQPRERPASSGGQRTQQLRQSAPTDDMEDDIPF